MKKLIICVLLFVSIATSAFASDWTTYRLPEEPDYIFSLPSSYHFFYHGMPEDSPSLKAVGITADQMKLQLGFNDAIALCYSDSFGSYFTVGKHPNDTIYDYTQLPDEQLKEVALLVANQLKTEVEARSNIIVGPTVCSTLTTDHAKFIAIQYPSSLGDVTQEVIQLISVCKGQQITFVYGSSNHDVFTSESRTFLKIVENFIPL